MTLFLTPFIYIENIYTLTTSVIHHVVLLLVILLIWTTKRLGRPHDKPLDPLHTLGRAINLLNWPI